MTNGHTPVANNGFLAGIRGFSRGGHADGFEVVLQGRMVKYRVAEMNLKQISEGTRGAVIDFHANAGPSEIRPDGEDSTGVEKIVFRFFNEGRKAGKVSHASGIGFCKMNWTVIHMHGLACHKMNLGLGRREIDIVVNYLYATRLPRKGQKDFAGFASLSPV
jgi:hypothetical protein